MIRFWIDNTGLQSVGCCLAHSARGQADVDGLLQLATFLVFSDSVLFSDFEEDTIASRSHRTLETLYALGVPSEVLSISNENQGSYSLACEKAARILPDRIRYSFRPNEEEIIFLEPADLPPRIDQALAAFINIAIHEPSSGEIEEIRNRAFEKKASGAVEFILASSRDVRKAIRELVRKTDAWSPRNAYQLNAHIRFFLNHTLAGQKESTYAPAVARARLVRQRNYFIIQRLSKGLDHIVRRLNGPTLSTPAISAALVARAKGRPKGIIEEALRLRELAKPLRGRLRREIANLDPEKTEDAFQADQEARYLLKRTQEELGLTPTESPVDALEVSFDLGIPDPSVSGRSLVGWAERAWTRRAVAVLTELSKAAAFSYDAADYGEKLLALSTDRS